MERGLGGRLPLATCLFFSLIALLYTCSPSLFQAYPISSGLFLFAFTNILIWIQAKKQIEIMGLLPQLAILMLWVMPALHYELVAHYPGIMQTPMAVDAPFYFSVAMPGVLAICWAYFLPLPTLDTGAIRANLNTALESVGFRPWVMGLLAAGCLFGFYGAAQVLPGWMQFLGFICRSFLYPLVLVAVFQPTLRYRLIWLAGMAILLLTDMIVTTSFGEFIGIMVMLLLYAVFIRQWAVWRIIVAQIIFGLLLYWVLAFKFEYRKTAQEQSNFQGRALAFVKSAVNPLYHPISPKITDVVISRLNQGHLMALVLRYVPAQQPFVHGETIWTAAKSALVPRLIWPDKPKAGGVENIRRFMGVENLGFSINLGVVGEAYVNYGVSIYFALFLIAYVLFFRFSLLAMVWQSQTYPWLLLLLPSVFFMVNFVEKDVTTLLNHVVKQGMLLTFIWTIFIGVKYLKKHTFARE